jgi:histidine triad (HIT) family protein
MSLWLRLARSPFSQRLVHLAFQHMTFALPIHRLRETKTLIAFRHPRPSYPWHILLVPKKPLAGLADLTAEDSEFLVELFQTVQSLVSEFGLEKSGYRLIANGGSFQDVAHLHFHLVAEAPPAGAGDG